MIIIDDEKYDKFNGNTAGSKARVDVYNIYENANLISIQNMKVFKLIDYLIFFHKINKLDDQETILLHYPLYNLNKKDIQKFLDIMAKKKVILLIHDINSLRYTPNDKKLINEEVEIINHFKVIVSHNQIMTNWLKRNNVTSKIIDLNIFDYLGSEIKSKDTKFDIAYAGNLTPEKSKFIYEMIKFNSDLDFEIYGNGFDSSVIKETNYCYNGSKKPEELLSCFQSKFGLVWDGDSIDTCQCDYGEYLKYNNPHKLSLYVSAQLPVIVWDQSAISYFVKQYNIGFSVASLKELKERIDSITSDEYNTMENNIKKLSHLVKQGHFIKNAVKQGEEYLNEL